MSRYLVKTDGWELPATDVGTGLGTLKAMEEQIEQILVASSGEGVGEGENELASLILVRDTDDMMGCKVTRDVQGIFALILSMDSFHHTYHQSQTCLNKIAKLLIIRYDPI